MRTLVIGDPTVEMEAISKAGTNALMNMMRIARPGISANAIAAETLAILEPVLSGRLYAYLPAYSVGIGFPACWVEFLGIEIKVGNDVLMEFGMTFHAIMSIRQFGEFGVNQSQTFVVTETGRRTADTRTVRSRSRLTRTTTNSCAGGGRQNRRAEADPTGQSVDAPRRPAPRRDLTEGCARSRRPRCSAITDRMRTASRLSIASSVAR